MPQESRIVDLILRWQDLHKQGQAPTPEEICAQTPELLEEFKHRLEDFANLASLMSAKAHAESQGATTTADVPNRPRPAPVAPAQLPGYEVLDVLGKGGMGIVYKARQLGLNRVVALKMILAGGNATAADIARFRTEAEAVARLQHPNIVQIHAIGEHDGLPYFSLEYCAGGSLAKKLNGTPLPPLDAARLVETLARAMQVAHEHGILHRDLKPANILLSGDARGLRNEPSSDVSPRDAGPETGGAREKTTVREATSVSSPAPHASSILASYSSSLIPKIADFGLAKKLDEDSGQTQAGAVMGTASYMAPEQAESKMEAFGPATDVYALGAILYELLTGRPPFKSANVWDTLHQVKHDEPVAPRQLQPKVHNDLETICLTCLRKEPNQRYASAAALAADLQRFLCDEPILARPTSRWEQLSRWRRRNPLVAGMAALLCTIVTVSLVTITWLWLGADYDRALALDAQGKAEVSALKALEQEALALEQKNAAEEQSRIADAEARKAKLVAQVLTEMFEASDPLGLKDSPLMGGKEGDSLLAKDLLDRGAARVAKTLGNEAAVQAQLLDTLGHVYCNMGLPEKAEPLLEQALAVRLSKLPKNHPELALTLYNLAWMHHQNGEFPKAKKFYGDAVSIYRNAGLADPLEYSKMLLCFAWLQSDMQEFAAAEAMVHEAIKLRVAALGEGHRDVAIARVALVGVHLNQGKFTEAIVPYLKARAIFAKQKDLAPLVESVESFQLAMLLRELPSASARLFGLGQPRDIEASFEHSLVMAKKAFGGERHSFVGLVNFEFGRSLENWNRDADAELRYVDALKIARRYGLHHPKILPLVRNLTQLWDRLGKKDETEQLINETLDVRLKKRGPDHITVAETLVIQAEALNRRGAKDRREEALREVVRIYRKHELESAQRDFAVQLKRLAAALLDSRDPIKATEAAQILREAVPLAKDRWGPRSVVAADTMALLGEALLAQNQEAAAAPILEESLSICRTEPARFANVLRAASRLLHRCYLRQKEPIKAAEATLERRRLASNTGVQLYAVAAELGKCVAILPHDSKERKTYADAMMEILRDAVAKGFNDFARMQSDRNLDPVRHRPELQQLMKKD